MWHWDKKHSRAFLRRLLSHRRNCDEIVSKLRRYCANFDDPVTIIFAKNRKKLARFFHLSPYLRRKTGGQVVNAEELRNLYLLRIFDIFKKVIVRKIWEKILIYESSKRSNSRWAWDQTFWPPGGPKNHSPGKIFPDPPLTADPSYHEWGKKPFLWK